MSHEVPQPWQNWSGSQRHEARLLVPADVDAVVDAVRDAAAAGARLRCVGSAHSFVPFWVDGPILSLDRISGLEAVDVERCQATVAAGTKLHALGPLLWEYGLSLPQQGDIDRQSVAGALSTGTHGTGRHLPSLSNYLRAVTLVTAAGELRTLSAADGALFSAAQVGQGLLGVMVSATLALEPAFHLHEKIWHCAFEACADSREALIDGNRHFEFFWTPRSDDCEMKTLNKTAADTMAGEGERVGPAYRIFPTDRDIRFNEMEYAVPLAAGWDCFLELRAMMLKDFSNLPWPVEYRTLAADDILLSPANGGDVVTLSVHQGAERDHRPLFASAEAIFRNHGGRPHWGKLHSLKADDLARLYPGFAEFQRCRRLMDPAGLFLNDYLAGLIGL